MGWCTFVETNNLICWPAASPKVFLKLTNNVYFCRRMRKSWTISAMSWRKKKRRRKEVGMEENQNGSTDNIPQHLSHRIQTGADSQQKCLNNGQEWVKIHIYFNIWYIYALCSFRFPNLTLTVWNYFKI